MFRNRIDAGKQLAGALEYLRPKNPLIMALPRGGVVLGAEVARRLEADLGLILVRKITHAGSPEYALGVAVEGGETLWNDAQVERLGVQWRQTEEIAAQEVLRERREYYFGGRSEPAMQGRCVIIVDDGLATGLTMYAAVQAATKAGASYLVAAAPVASGSAVDMVRPAVDELVILADAADFGGYVGSQYEHFDQVSDEDVRLLLHQSIHHTRDGP